MAVRQASTAISMLGGFTVSDGRATRARLSPQAETVFALLVANKGEFVTVDDLIAEVWGGSPPAAARNTIQVYICCLRKIASTATPPLFDIQYARHRYQLILPEMSTDVDVVSALMTDARRCARSAAAREAAAQEAVDKYAEAFDLWHGAPLDGVLCGPRLQQFQRRLAAERIDALAHYAKLLITVGQYTAAVEILKSLLRSDPYRETAYADLMVALASMGCRYEALRVFATASRLLREALGLDPGADLAEVHQKVLRGDYLTTPVRDRMSVAVA